MATGIGLGLYLAVPQPSPLRESGPAPIRSTYPGREWEFRAPAEVGLDAWRLHRVQRQLGGRGAVVRFGYMAYTWGDQSRPGDVASVAKVFHSTFLLKAVEEGRLDGVDARVVDYAPCLGALNASLGHKDRAITFRHLANQTAGYGATERPGEAFNYSDWQAALFADALFLGVYGVASWATVDEEVFRPGLGEILQFQDDPTLLAFGPSNRAGRLRISPRDLARFGLLFLRRGDWNGTPVVSAESVVAATTSPLDNSVPRTAGVEAEVCPGQRTLGSPSAAIAESLTDHMGSYSFTWWTNGVDRTGRRVWPDAPADAYMACGHRNCRRALVVIPSLDMVVVWTDTALGRSRRTREATVNEALGLVVRAARAAP